MPKAKHRRATLPRTQVRGGGRGLVSVVVLVLLLLVILSLVPAPGTPKWFAYMVSAGNYLRFDLFFAECEFRELRILDKDDDGNGEFGALADLLAQAATISATRRFKEPDLFRPELGEAKICWGAYLLRVYVPGDTGLGEELWCATAWPASTDGRALYTIVLYVSPDFPRGRIGVVKDRRYCGWGNGPKLEEIFVADPFNSDVDWDRWKGWGDLWQP